MKESVSRALRMGAQGIRIQCGGRLGGSGRSRARNGTGKAGFRCIRYGADVNYGLAEAKTTYGVIGVKAWIFRGEILTKQEEQQKATLGL